MAGLDDVGTDRHSRHAESNALSLVVAALSSERAHPLMMRGSAA
jgi:hypothetical protein